MRRPGILQRQGWPPGAERRLAEAAGECDVRAFGAVGTSWSGHRDRGRDEGSPTGDRDAMNGGSGGKLGGSGGRLARKHRRETSMGDIGAKHRSTTHHLVTALVALTLPSAIAEA